MSGRWELDEIVGALDELFELAAEQPDPAMSRFVPAVYEQAGQDWRRWATARFAERFNGLMIRGGQQVGRVFAACFPSADVLDVWLDRAEPGDLLVTHHPIDCRNGGPQGGPDGTWAEGFVPITQDRLDAIISRRLSVYSCHAPMDASLTVGTTAAMVEALSGRLEASFWPYGNGFAGRVCAIDPLSSEQLVARVGQIFGVHPVEVAGARRERIERVAIIAGVGDKPPALAEAESLGAEAYLTGELHVRIEGEYGRRKYAEVREFARSTGMTLLGVSHAASEQLVMGTQLARWFQRTLGIDIRPITEPEWWR